MKIQGDAFTRVQTPPPKCRKYLFHVALTEEGIKKCLNKEP